MSKSIDETADFHYHHKSKGLNNNNLRRQSFESHASDNPPLMYAYPPQSQYSFNPSPPGSFYNYSTYPSQQGMIYPSSIPSMPMYNPIPQPYSYVPVTGSYLTPASPLELQRDRLEKFERLHEEQLETGMTVEEAEAVNEAIQLSLLELDSNKHPIEDHTRANSTDNTEYSSIVHSSSMIGTDNTDIIDDPIDRADNQALKEGIRLSLYESQQEQESTAIDPIYNIPSPPLPPTSSGTTTVTTSTPERNENTIISSLPTTEEHSASDEKHSKSDEDLSVSDEEHSVSDEEHSETIEEHFNPVEEHSETNEEHSASNTALIRYKRRSSSFSLKKAATGLAHTCSNLLKTAWHSMDRKDKHLSSSTTRSSNDYNSNTAIVDLVEENDDDDDDSVVSTTSTIASYANIPVTIPISTSIGMEENTTNNITSRTPACNTSTLAPNPFYPDTISTVPQPLNDTVISTTAESSPVDNNNMLGVSTVEPPSQLPPRHNRRSGSSTSPSSDHALDHTEHTTRHTVRRNSRSPTATHRKSGSTTSNSGSTTTNSSFDSPALTPHTHHAARRPSSDSITELTSSQQSMEGPHTAVTPMLHTYRHSSPQRIPHYMPQPLPVQYTGTSPQYNEPVVRSVPSSIPAQFLPPQQMRYSTTPMYVPVQGPAPHTMSQPVQYMPQSLPPPQRYTSPQQMPYARNTVPLPQRYASPQQMPYARNTVPLPQRYASPQQMPYTRNTVQPLQRYASPQQMPYTRNTVQPLQRYASPEQIRYVQVSPTMSNTFPVQRSSSTGQPHRHKHTSL